jgi:hypothetical protein
MKFQQKMTQAIKQAILASIKLLGIEIHRVGNNKKSTYALGYIPAKETIHAAYKDNLSVGDYLEKIWNEQDNRQKIIDNLKQFGIFNNQTIKNVCEIGTGAGLYVEKIIDLCHPIRYESYEPDEDWAKWLTEKYQLISHPTDGKSLSFTPTSSINLVLSHGVFVYLPFLVTYRYFQEIVRVTNNSGYVVFDILSENCFDEETVQFWLESNQIFPCFLSENYVIDYFTKNDFIFIGQFFNSKFNVGKSQYFIFKKRA